MNLSLDVHVTSEIHDNVDLLGNGKIVVGPYAKIKSGCVLDTGNNPASIIQIGSRSNIKTGCILKSYGGSIIIGHRVSVGEYSVLSGHGGIEIGNFCILAPYVMLNAAAHITSDNHPFRLQGETATGIDIAEDVWIGTRTTLLDGVSIGSRTIIGAHSLVNKCVPENSKCFGLPAKITGRIINDGD